MRSRLTTILLVIAAITLPAVMAAAVFYASSEAIGETPTGLTPHFGGGTTAHRAAPEPAKTTVKRHRKPGVGTPSSTTTATTDNHGGGGGSTGSDDGSHGGSGGGGSGGSGHGSGGGSDGGGDS
jgi:hypothetical protein